jgi:hypothetical protein
MRKRRVDCKRTLELFDRTFERKGHTVADVRLEHGELAAILVSKKNKQHLI